MNFVNSSPQLSLTCARETVSQQVLAGIFRALNALFQSLPKLMMAALAVMLFRPPDFPFYSMDRVAVAALLFVVILRALLLRQSPGWGFRVSLPLVGLTLLGLWSVATQPYEAELWSVFAAKWIIPFIFFHVAGCAFQSPSSLRHLETFLLLLLAYLIAMAIFFMAGATSLIFPRYILDEALGIHFDRARGPFLNAVANGVTLNWLGLIGMDAFRRRKLRAVPALLLLAGLPLSILATKTRAVWFAFVLSIALLALTSPSFRLRRACRVLLLIGGIGILAALSLPEAGRSLSERLREREPVEFRRDMYRAGWDMIKERPLLGWNSNSIQSELSRRVPDFQPERFIFHNTYLEIAVEHGMIGIALYVWLMIDLFRLGAKYFGSSTPDSNFLGQQSYVLWPLLLMVYLVNASFVVMNYQFVNGLLFTIAGILAAQKRNA